MKIIDLLLFNSSILIVLCYRYGGYPVVCKMVDMHDSKKDKCGHCAQVLRFTKVDFDRPAEVFSFTFCHPNVKSAAIRAIGSGG